MTRYVVDASIALKWVSVEDYADQARRLLRTDNDLLAPRFVLIESANALWKKVRRGWLTGDEAGRALARLEEPLALVDERAILLDALRIAIEYGRTVYDSLYLVLSLEERASLVTADRKFYNAVPASLRETMLWVEDVPE